MESLSIGAWTHVMDGSAPLIGYFAKAATRGGDWVKLPGTEEICSVSTCIAAGPEGWIERWQHNAMWLYPSEGAARSIIGEEDASRFDIFAYRIEPIGFDREGCSQPLVESPPGSCNRLPSRSSSACSRDIPACSGVDPPGPHRLY